MKNVRTKNSSGFAIWLAVLLISLVILIGMGSINAAAQSTSADFLFVTTLPEDQFSNAYPNGNSFTKLKALVENQGYKTTYIDLNKVRLTSDLLKDKKIVMLIGEYPFAWYSKRSIDAEEIKAVSDFVNNGGGLFVTSNVDYNGITQQFGVTLSGNNGGSTGLDWPLYNIDATYFENHPVTEGMTRITGDCGDKITVSAPARIIGYQNRGGEPLLAVSTKGSGKVIVWFGVGSFLDGRIPTNAYQSSIEDADNKKFIRNSISWLSSHPITTPIPLTPTPQTTGSLTVSSSPSGSREYSQLWLNKGSVFMEAGKYNEALNAFDKAIEFDPNNAEAWEGKGIALQDLGRNQEAVYALDKALELNPDNLNILFTKGVALNAWGKRQEAIAIAQEVINKSDRLIAVNPSDDSAWHYKGSELVFLGKNDEAIAALDKAISINPNNPHTWYTKGEALFNLRRYQEAVNSYDKATGLNPNLPYFWRNKGDALKALGKYQEANEAYDKAYEVTITAPTPSIGDGLQYFALPGFVSLVVLGLVLFLEKKEKNKLKFRDNLKASHWFGYYAFIIGYFIIGAIFALISFTVFFQELPLSFDNGKFFFAIPIFYLSMSSFILIIGLRKSRPNIKLNSLHLIISLLMGIFFIFIIFADPQKSPPVIFPVLLLISSGISVWYDRVAISRPESIQKSLSVEKIKEKSIFEPEIKRGYAVLPNNDIKFGIRVTNTTGYTITDVDTILDYTEELFKLKKSKLQRIGNIPPDTARTAAYILKPLGCIHNENINAIISYTDATGKKHALHMRPKEVHCVCPFLKEKPLSEGEYSRLAASSEFVQEGISFKGISVEELAKFMGETCRHMLYKVREYDLEGKKVIYLSGESLGEKAYYLLTAVIQEYKGLTQVLLRAHSDKKYGLNGFMNEMADSVRHLVGSVQSAKEIGIIENTQVINIIDSVVQRTIFEMGEGGNNVNVNIKDSLVQRTDIRKRQNKEE